MSEGIELANGAIKSSYLVSLANSVNPPLTIASNNSELSGKQLPDQIAEIKRLYGHDTRLLRLECSEFPRSEIHENINPCLLII